MTPNEQKLQDLLAHAPVGITLCHAAYCVIDEAPVDEKAGLLEYFAARYGYTPTDCTMVFPKFMSERKKARLMKEYLLHVDAYVSILQDMDLPKAEFYKRLWDYISTSPSLPTLKARVFALYNCVIDSRIPYFPLDRASALTMSQEDFKKYTASIGDEVLGRMNYILSTNFAQRTEQASLLLALLDSLKSFNERTVFLVQLICYFTTDPYKQRERDLFQIFGCGSSLADLFFEDDDDANE